MLVMIRLKTIFSFHYQSELFHSFSLDVITHPSWKWSLVSKLDGGVMLEPRDTGPY